MLTTAWNITSTPARTLIRGWQRLQRTGIASTFWRIASRGQWALFERCCRLDTGGSIDGSQLGHGPDRYGYQPIDCHSFRAAMRQVPWQAGHDVFLDYGCGKGRALLLAGRLPLRRVVGVEQAPRLCDIARQNLYRSRRWLRCGAAEVLQHDASTFHLPDDITIVFFYNPFTGEVMQRVLQEIKASLKRRARNLHLIYALPATDPDRLAECRWLTPVVMVRTCQSDWLRMTVYRAGSCEPTDCPAGQEATPTGVSAPLVGWQGVGG